MGTSLGSSRAVAAFRGVVAVGTSSSIVGVLMPRGLSADGHPSGSAPPPACYHAVSMLQICFMASVFAASELHLLLLLQ